MSKVLCLFVAIFVYIRQVAQRIKTEKSLHKNRLKITLKCFSGNS